MSPGVTLSFLLPTDPLRASSTGPSSIGWSLPRLDAGLVVPVPRACQVATIPQTDHGA